MDQLVSLPNLFRLSSGPLCRRRSPATESIAAVSQRRTSASTSSPASSTEAAAFAASMQLQAFGEAVGTQSRGLSDDLICYLVPFRNKCNFSSKKNHEECVICKSTYKSRQKLIRLPCSNCYHADCITRWLKINKACPVCKEEVFG